MILNSLWLGWIWNLDAWQIVGCMASLVLFIRGLIVYYPLRGGYFSGLFVLALGPYLCCSLAAIIHVMDLGYLGELDRTVGIILKWAKFGFTTSLLSILLYSVVYAVSHRRPVTDFVHESTDVTATERGLDP